AYTMKGAMKRDRLLEETREALAKTGFFLSRPHGERGLSFDLVARRDDTLLIVKVLQNVDALARETAHELKVIARTLEGSPLVVGERTGTGALEDGVIYNRFGVPILSRPTLLEFLEEGVPPFLYSAPGGLYVRLDSSALRRLREDRQVSLGTLADIAGVSRRTIQLYLEGLPAPADVSRVRAQVSVMFVVRRSVGRSIRGVPLIAREELRRMRDSDDVEDMISERKG